MRLLVLDLDGTIWDHEDASRLDPPYEFHGGHLTDAHGEELHLFPGAREFVEWASERFVLSIASWNVGEKVRAILEGFDLWGYFRYPKIENHPGKGDMIARTVHELKSSGYKVDAVIYVGDRDVHIEDVKATVSSIQFVHMWVDVKSFEELRELLRN